MPSEFVTRSISEHLRRMVKSLGQTLSPFQAIRAEMVRRILGEINVGFIHD